MRSPTFLVIGAKRSGTTSLARYLGEHPEVFMAEVKEVHYFDRHLDRGEEWYRAHFADADGASQVGEATQTYLFDPRIPPRMATALPDAKLVAVLRNPVDRAYSDYWWRRSRGLEDLSFEEALDAEPKRAVSGDDAFWGTSYVARGRYADQLERVLQHYPAEQVHVLLTDDLEADPEAAYRDVCAFLDVRTDVTPGLLGQRVNQYVAFRSTAVRQVTKALPGPLARVAGRVNQRRGERYEAMRPATRTRLVELFREPNRRLGSLLGRDLAHWDA